MKVLFVNNFKSPDYLNDCIYHGLSELDNITLYNTTYPSYMMKNYKNKNKLYGKGFTIFGLLENKIILDNNIEKKIKEKFYDKIIYGSVHRDFSYSDLVFSVYSKENILCFDGEDHTQIKKNLLNKCRYFKRELIYSDKNLEPICFSVPEEKIIKEKSVKKKLFGTVIPGKKETYIFTKENEYYSDYSISYYGNTCKKGGWDCMRHYEIMAAYSVPSFLNLEKCPERTMVYFPKKLILEFNKFSLENKIHPNYNEMNDELHDYFKNNLTTKRIIERII